LTFRHTSPQKINSSSFMSWNEYKSFQIEQETKNMIAILFKPLSFEDHIYNYAIWCQGPTYCKVVALGTPFSPFYKHHYQNVLLVVKFPLATFKWTQNEVSLYEVFLTQRLRCVDPFLDPSTLLFVIRFCFNSCN
jgi:hypothetical protein